MRILFVCGEYYPLPSANGVCVTRLQEAFSTRGILSDVICIGNTASSKEQENRFGIIHYVDQSMSGCSNVIKKLRVLNTWPIKNPSLIQEYVSAILDLKKRYKYSLIISVMRPIEGALACSKVGDFVLYELDSITNNFDNLYGIKKILSFRSYKIEMEIYKKAVAIFHLQCHKQFYSDNRYDCVREKFIFTDIPHLVPKGKKEKTAKHDIIQVIFTGALVKERNSPEYAIKLFEGLSSVMKVKCAFYSRGNCEELIKRENEKHPQIIERKGYVSQSELKDATQNVDAFLSIGSHLKKSVSSIPSKVIEYMASGKPIIHILGDNDTAVPYLNEYGNALIINEKDSYEENILKLQTFFETHMEYAVDIEELRTRLPMNTPEWTVKKMLANAKNE